MRVVILPLYWVWWGHTWSSVFNSWLPSTRETWAYWKESKKIPQKWWQGCIILPVRKDWVSWISLDWRREASEGNWVLYIDNLIGGCKEDKAKLFSVLPSDRTTANGHKLQIHRMFPLNIREHFFTLSMTEYLHRLPGRLWSLCPSRSSKATWNGPGQSYLDGPAGARGFDQVDSTGHLTSASLWFATVLCHHNFYDSSWV